MLGLKLVTACLDSMRSMEDSSRASAADILQGVGEGLLAFPLTPATRIALVEVTCCGTPWLEVGGHAHVCVCVYVYVYVYVCVCVRGRRCRCEPGCVCVA